MCYDQRRRNGVASNNAIFFISKAEKFFFLNLGRTRFKITKKEGLSSLENFLCWVGLLWFSRVCVVR